MRDILFLVGREVVVNSQLILVVAKLKSFFVLCNRLGGKKTTQRL